MSGRLPDWETRLSAYIAKVSSDLDAMGKLPCARFAASAAFAQTGVDNYKAFRGKYSTELGAAKALAKYGAGTLDATFSMFYVEKPVGYAQRGDIVFDGEAVGICVGADALFVGHETTDGKHLGPVVLIRKSRAEWRKAWAV